MTQGPNHPDVCLEVVATSKQRPGVSTASSPEERTIAMTFLPDKPKADGDTLAYFFRDTCTIGSSSETISPPFGPHAMTVNMLCKVYGSVMLKEDVPMLTRKL